MRGLDPGALGEGQARLGDPLGELVAQPLELAEVEDPRLAPTAATAVVDLDPAEGLGEEAGELALEAADLPPQLDAGEALVDLDVQPVRLSLSSRSGIGLTPSVDHRTAPLASAETVKRLGGSCERRRRHPERLVDGDLRHAARPGSRRSRPARLSGPTA